MQIVIAADHHNCQQYQQNQSTGQNDQQNLPVNDTGGSDKPQHTGNLAVGVDHGTGNRHNPLVGMGVTPHIGLDHPGADCLGNLRRAGRIPWPLAVGRSHQVSIPVNKLQFDFIFALIGLGIDDARLKISVIGLIQIIGKKLHGCVGTVFQIPLHAAVIVGRKRGGNRQNAYQSQCQHHTGCIQQPALLQSTHIENGFEFFSHYAPHL